jgi:hypothetical protein
MFFEQPQKKDLILLLVVFLSLFSTLSSLFAKGRQDEVFKEVDQLVAGRNYVEAIERLVQMVRDDPSLFDRVQSRLQSIMRSSNRYTEVATQLLDTIEQDPSNAEKIFELSQSLSDLGVARTEDAYKFIQEIQQVARLSVYSNQLDNILVNGRILIDSGRYLDAYNLYKLGFSLYLDLFAESDYPQSVKSSVNANQRTIDSITTSINQEAPRIQEIAAEFAMLPVTSDNPQEQFLAIAQAVSRFRNELDVFIRIKDLACDVRDAYREYERIENSDEGRYHIIFGNLLINGRPKEDVREGVLGAMDGLWRLVINPLAEIANTAAESIFSTIFDAVSSHDYALARRLITETSTALRGPLDILTMHNLFEARDDPGHLVLFGRTLRDADISYYALIESLNRILPLLSQTIDYTERYDAATSEMLVSTTLSDYRENQITAAQAVQREIGIRFPIYELEANIRMLNNTLEQNLNELAPLSSLYDGVSRSEGFFRSGLALSKSLGDNLSTILIASMSRQYVVESEDFAQPYPLRLSLFNAGSALSDGVLKTLDTGQRYLSKDPFQASLTFSSLITVLSDDLAKGRALLDRYDREDTNMTNNRELREIRTEIARQLALYEALYDQSTETVTVVRRAIEEAETLRVAGAQLYQNAVSALDRVELDEAATYLSRSDIQYGASLAIQDSGPLRAESRERSLALSAEIMRVRRELVRQEIAGLLDRAQLEFYANNYELADQLLVRAQTHHATISDEEDPSIRYWLTIVRNALTFRTGRTIAFTAPLYSEMSQLLSTASMEYNEGMNLLNSRREEALEYFGSARQKTQEVKLLFPLNQEANLLELRMDQVVDPAAFNQSFRQRLDAAIAGTKLSDLQAFADLQDLAMINPNYRGMTQIIYQAEVDMGVRPPPPDEVAIARSRDLTRAAQNLIAGGVRSNLEIAQEQLNEALRVNPDNTTAQTELDRVQRLMGRRAASELEAAADHDYEEALRELLAGNKLIAYSIVRRILARPEYRNSTRFQELLQRIESVL